MSCQVKSGKKNTIQVINGIVDRKLSPGVQVGFKINGIKNPSKSSSGTDTDIIIRTISSNGYQIDNSGTTNFKIGCIYPCSTCSND
jgi:hypothetical protein